MSGLGWGWPIAATLALIALVGFLRILLSDLVASEKAPGAPRRREDQDELRHRLEEIPTITIQEARRRSDVRGLYPDPGLGAFFGYVPSAPQRTLTTLEGILDRGGRAFLACLGTTILGYLALAYPGDEQPWGRITGVPVWEVSVEVARGRRRGGLARRLFAALLVDPGVEDIILVSTAYRWCWDLGGPGVEASDPETYSRRLYRLFAAAGFARRVTNEPNVVLDPANFLAVRTGTRVTAEQAHRFEQTLFTVRAA